MEDRFLEPADDEAVDIVSPEDQFQNLAEHISRSSKILKMVDMRMNSVGCKLTKTFVASMIRPLSTKSLSDQKYSSKSRKLKCWLHMDRL